MVGNNCIPLLSIVVPSRAIVQCHAIPKMCCGNNYIRVMDLGGGGGGGGGGPGPPTPLMEKECRYS